MKITEVKEGSNVTITVTKGLVRMQFESKVIKSIKEGLLIEPVNYEDQYLNFHVSKSVIINVVILTEDAKPFEWKDVKIIFVEYNNIKYNLIVTSEDAKLVNRRSSFRVFVGAKAVVQLGFNTKAHEMVVKDISETGVALISDNYIEVKGNEPVRIVFSDNDFKFILRASLVRIRQLDNKKTLYGCKLESGNKDINKYINMKQIEQLKSKNIRVRKLK